MTEKDIEDLTGYSIHDYSHFWIQHGSIKLDDYIKYLNDEISLSEYIKTYNYDPN